jgi:hypothetical protein
VSRVVLPHLVMPQFIEALSTNVELYRQRYGELPGSPPVISLAVSSHNVHSASSAPPLQTPPLQTPLQQAPAGNANPSPELGLFGSSPDPRPAEASSSPGGDQHPPTPGSAPAMPGAAMRRHNPQEIYDELKIRDEILSGSYANAVMIGHGPYEFSFDFITNFYPQSAVSARVYMGAGHVWRMLDSLKQSWEQVRPRFGFPPQPPGPPGHGTFGGSPE